MQATSTIWQISTQRVQKVLQINVQRQARKEQEGKGPKTATTTANVSWRTNAGQIEKTTTGQAAAAATDTGWQRVAFYKLNWMDFH